MDKPIFPNCSYFVVVCDGEHAKPILASLEAIKARSFVANDSAAFLNVAALIRRISGLLVFTESLSQVAISTILSAASQKRIPFKLITSKSHIEGVDSANLMVTDTSKLNENSNKIVSDFFNLVIPKGLPEALIESANAVIPSFFGRLGPVKRVPYLRDGFNIQISFSIVAGDILGYATARADTEQLAKFLPTNNKIPVISHLQEATNQILGLIVQRLVSLGIESKVGLPTIFDLKRVPEIEPMIYFPQVHVADEKSTLAISLGFVHLTQPLQLDFTGSKAGTSTGDVDFL